VRFGTSSFSSTDWVGPFYPPGTRPGDFLRLYAERFDTVEIDSTYYAIPPLRTVDGWVSKTPEGFVVATKFPRSIVHGGERAATDAERDLFLSTVERLGRRLGPLVLQFPFFGRDAFPSQEAFLERLDRFLERLPRGPSYAVEVRNPDWMNRPLRDLLARRGVAMVLVDQAWMPHGDEVERDLDPVTAGFAYVRLLGDRKEVEALTKTFDREVIDRGDRLARWAKVLARLAARGVRTFVYVNNHYAGHGPTTTRRLKDLFESEVATAG
jgi:uncharacterized protein YecE (DUF72 family)